MSFPQKESPAIAGRGFPNSFGGECDENLYSEISKKSSTAKMKWAGPVIVRPTPPNEYGGTLLALTDGTIDSNSRLWNVGDTIHPFQLLHAARKAAENGRVLLLAVVGDGQPADFSICLDKAEAWLRGQGGE